MLDSDCSSSRCSVGRSSPTRTSSSDCKSGAPLAAPRADLFYTAGAEGYSDYPALGA